MLLRLLLAVPILFMPNMLHFAFDTGVPGLNIANIVFLLVVGVLVISGRKNKPDEKWGQLTPPLFFLYAVLLIGFVLAQVTSPTSFMEDFTYLKNAIFYTLLYFVYRHCGQDLKGTRQLIILVMVVAAIAGVEAIREGLDYGIGRYSETRRASGPFGVDYRDANRAGVFYAMFLPMFIAMALFFKGQKFWRAAALVGCAILAIAIMVTYSRQSYLIALVGLSLLLLRRNVLLAGIIALLMLPAMSLLPASVTQRVAETEQKDAVGAEQLDVSTASRFDIWAGGLQMWQEHPAGVGLNRFPHFIGTYTPAYKGYDAHNIYVRTLAEYGPLGIAALLWLLWRMLKLGLVIRRSAPPADTEAKALGIGFTVAVICMALGNMYGSPFFEGPVMANFWALCGLMEHYASLKRQARSDSGPTQSAQDQQDLNSMGARFPLASRAQPGRYAPAPAPSAYVDHGEAGVRGSR